MARYFISAGWPYLYDVPGLHNCIPMLFGDVYARFFRLMGDEVFFLSGADEHGARIEFMARGYGKKPQVLVDEKYLETIPLLKQLGLSFDQFGRTTNTKHKEFVRKLVGQLIDKQKVTLKKQPVPYCVACNLYLPDRFIEGQCPFCSEASYGGQCNNKKSCGRIIESVDNGHCAICGGTYELRERLHAMFPLSSWRETVAPAIRCDGQHGITVQKRVIETFDTVDEVMLTRDSWGIDIPLENGTNQSVYSWVDSLLGKVSFVAFSGPTAEADFWKDDDTRRVFFLGMDGIPFYGALFPSLLLAAQDGYSVANWTIIPNEVLIYEGGVCSKSTGRGIWLSEALKVAKADFWRFSLFYSYAEAERDIDFQWNKFAGAINRYLIDGLEANVERLISAPPNGTDLE
ncbi:MAG: class I tRNA ligase family protein, partial [Candidatus Melainabacteria bacterium]|nr:class I tRNA ligase family protein [Candidatus Melainabacteria bacterium]